MFQHGARFLLSAHRLDQAPEDTGREVAFTGRSNSGKSSVINALTGIGGLARTSRTPGRTQCLNFFDAGTHARIVDLPGYGYARAPRAAQRHWMQTINAYLEARHSLRGLVLIADIRRGLLPPDCQLLAWCAAAPVPVHVLLNKSDKVSRAAAARTLAVVRRDSAAAGVSVQLFSALKKTGVDELRAVLSAWLA